MSRYQASFYHLLISLVIFFALAYLVLFHWYPDFFFAIDGGWEGMRIIFGVDLILGPLLTLCVFKAGKPGLKFDLTVIGALQLAGLVAGVAIVYSERPIFFIYYEKHFYSSSADTFANYGVSTPDPLRFTQKPPARVISLMPENPIIEANFRRTLFHDRIPAWVYEPTYSNLEPYLDRVLEQGAQEKEIRERDKYGNLDRWLESHGGGFEDYAFIPIHSRYRDAYLAIHKSNKEFVDILEVPSPLASR